MRVNIFDIVGLTMRIVIVCLTVLFSACASHHSTASSDSIANTEQDSIQSIHDMSAEARQWADSVIANMTIEEMAGQLIMPAVFSDVNFPNLRLIRHYASDCHVGGLVLLKGTVPAAAEIADTLRRIMPVAPFIAIDAEWGLAMRLAHTPEFPRNGRISPAVEETAMFDYGTELARECREVGINMVLGPVLDVLPEGNGGAGIGSRSFGTDPQRVARLGVAYSKGLESCAVVSVAKHFPGHGAADADSHKRMPAVAKTREQLEASDLIPFRDYIANGMSAIMTGHLFVPALDEEERPVTVSQKIMKDFIRDELGFKGLILTDAINMAGAEGYSAADAIIAGADIVLAPADTDESIAGIMDAVRNGSMPVAILRDRVGRVLFYKYMTARVSDATGKITETDETERIIKLLR